MTSLTLGMGLEAVESALESRWHSWSLISVSLKSRQTWSPAAESMISVTSVSQRVAVSWSVCLGGADWQPLGSSPLGLRVSSPFSFLPRFCCFPWNRLELFPGRRGDWASQSSELNEELIHSVNKYFWVLTVCSRVCDFIGLPWSALCCPLPWTFPGYGLPDVSSAKRKLLLTICSDSLSTWCPLTPPGGIGES